MFVIKTVVWLILYPLVLIGYAVINGLQLLSFLFNSPVDIWMIVSDSIDEMARQE